jgi:hypothetical protein
MRCFAVYCDSLMIRCFEHLNTACYCNSSETGSKCVIMIADEILRRVSIRSRFPQRYVLSRRR